MADIQNSSGITGEQGLLDLSYAESTVEATIVESTLESKSKASKQVLISCMIGNALEWYDFVIYGYFAVILGALFFPNANPLVQILASWGVFWSGFLARPLGSIVFGHIGDKTSRKYALTLSIYLMAIPTMLMGCLPTYDQIGITATLLLILLRTFQGFAIGGEFTGSMVFLIEHAPQSKRGFWGSWASFSAVLGVVLGSTLVASLNHNFSPDEMKLWGWRIPFIVSILGSFVGGYMRRQLADPSIYLDVKTRRKAESVPLKDLFSDHKSKMGMIILLDFLTAIGFFIVAIFMATYFRTYLKYSEKIAFSINTFNMCVFAIAILAGGWLSDRFGRKRTLGYPCIGFIILSYPLFMLLQTGSTYTLLGVQAVFAILMGLFFGTIPATLAEIMPTSVRFSGLSIAHNISMAIFGGGTPFLATHLIQYTNNLASPACLLIAASILSLSSLFFITDRYKSSL